MRTAKLTVVVLLANGPEGTESTVRAFNGKLERDRALDMVCGGMYLDQVAEFNRAQAAGELDPHCEAEDIPQRPSIADLEQMFHTIIVDYTEALV
jgi:hypothetical protein